MIKSTDRKLVVGLEIGTAKVVALVGEILPEGVINIIGVGIGPSLGIDKGEINNLELTVKCVQRSINQAEIMADCHISSVYLAISGNCIRCQNEIGMVPIPKEEVTQEDIENVMHIAKSVRVCDQHRILHVIPQEYSIDSQKGIKNPIGLSGIRMQAKVHLITCHNDIVKNMIKVVEHCDLEVDQLIFSGLASSYSVLTKYECEIGVCVIDIGGGTMDIVIYTDGAIRYTKVIPYAGNVVTNDIAYAFNTPTSEAEIIKIHHGCALSSIVRKNDNIDLPSMNKNILNVSVQRQTLSKVIEPRCTELLKLVNKEILHLQEQLYQQKIKYHLEAGIVLTGGSSKIEGIISCAQDVFKTKVRIGTPLNITGLIDYIQEPYCSTVTGLLHYGKEFYLSSGLQEKKFSAINTWLNRLKNWFKKEF